MGFLQSTRTNLARIIAPKPQASFAGSGYGRRMLGMRSSTQGINSLVLGNGETLRGRVRQLALDNPWVSAALDSAVGNIVGTGILPEFLHPKKDVRDNLKKLWRLSGTQMDATGLTDVYGLQALACRSVLEAGESLARVRPRYASDGLYVPMQLQMIEPEQLPYWKMDGGYGGNIVRGGIEFDPLNRRVAYHFYKQHPGDVVMWPNDLNIVRVAAKEVMHVFRPLRASQFRGFTAFAQIIVMLNELDQYDDAELVRKKLSTMFVGWMKSNNPDDPMLPQSTTSGNDTAPAKTAYTDIQPGTFLDTEQNEDIGWNTPPDVGTQYETFMSSQLRKFSAGFGLATYEAISGDVSKVNFTSSRVARIEIKRRCEQFAAHVLVFQFCQPTAKAWMDAAALSGAIDANDYAANPTDYLDIVWRTPRWEFVDPLKEAEAQKMEVRCGFKSRRGVIQENGDDQEQINSEIELDNATADEKGFIFDSDPRVTDARGKEDGPGTANDEPAAPVTGGKDKAI